MGIFANSRWAWLTTGLGLGYVTLHSSYLFPVRASLVEVQNCRDPGLALPDDDETVCLLQSSLVVRQQPVPIENREDQGQSEQRGMSGTVDVSVKGFPTSPSAQTFSISAASNGSAQIKHMASDKALNLPRLSLVSNKTDFEPSNHRPFFDPAVQKEKQNTAAYIFAVTTNSRNDLATLINSLSLYTSLIAAVILLFSSLRLCLPLVYMNNALQDSELDNDLSNRVPHDLRPSSSFFAWICSSLQLSVDDVTEVAGLDMAMLLEFSHFSMRLLLNIGLPMLIVTCPLNYVCGDKYDKLHRFGMGSLPINSWTYWVQALAVSYVIVRMQSLMFQAQAQFKDRRFQWLWSVRAPRGQSLVVEHIPLKYRSEKALRKFIDKDVFGADVVQRLSFVRTEKQLGELLKLKRKRTQSERHLKELAGTDGEREERQQLENINQEIRSTIEGLGEACGTAFVTFKKRRDAVIFSTVRLTEDGDDFLMVLPPEPHDVNYEALKLGSEWKLPMYLTGSFLVVLLFFFFIPIVAFITSFIKIANLAVYFPVILKLVERYPVLMEWDTVAATLALNIVMGLLPFLMMTIFRKFIPSAWSSDAQLLLARWYFRFQVIFVVLLTSVGSSLWEVTAELVHDPTTTILRSANALPATSSFYLNWFVLQWGSEALQLLRLFNCFKFIVCIIIGYFGEWGDTKHARAKELSEPEDQDCYGIGSRSANLTLYLATALIYCNITPLITIAAFVAFGVIRIVLGYLVVFAETRKPDSGGMFWDQQMKQLQYMMVMYIVVMFAVVSASDTRAGFAVLPALGYQIYCLYRFEVTFRIDKMTLEWVGKREEEDRQRLERKKSAQSVSETIRSALKLENVQEEPPEASYKDPVCDSDC